LQRKIYSPYTEGAEVNPMEEAIKLIEYERSIPRAEAAAGKPRTRGIPKEPVAATGLLEITGK
jgi:hypothetical protein